MFIILLLSILRIRLVFNLSLRLGLLLRRFREVVVLQQFTRTLPTLWNHSIPFGDSPDSTSTINHQSDSPVHSQAQPCRAAALCLSTTSNSSLWSSSSKSVIRLHRTLWSQLTPAMIYVQSDTTKIKWAKIYANYVLCISVLDVEAMVYASNAVLHRITEL